MDIRPELPNITRLNVSERGIWYQYQREYYRYFEYYSCENVDYGEMKNAVDEFIRDRLDTLSLDLSPQAAETVAFYMYAMDNYTQNLNLLMDIYLLDSMWHWGEHIEANRVEWYIMFKYGPY